MAEDEAEDEAVGAIGELEARDVEAGDGAVGPRAGVVEALG